MHTMIATLILLITLYGEWGAVNGQALPWQRLSRRTNVRAALANKQDPNFWPTRGRRTYTERQATDDEGPFWANRGRNVNNLNYDDGPFWANRGRALQDDAFSTSSEQQGPFWANRGRSINDDDTFSQRLQRDILYAEEPGWISLPQHGGRRSANEDTFWVSRGKKADPSLFRTKKHKWQKQAL